MDGKSKREREKSMIWGELRLPWFTDKEKYTFKVHTIHSFDHPSFIQQNCDRLWSRRLILLVSYNSIFAFVLRSLLCLIFFFTSSLPFPPSPPLPSHSSSSSFHSAKLTNTFDVINLSGNSVAVFLLPFRTTWVTNDVIARVWKLPSKYTSHLKI